MAKMKIRFGDFGKRRRGCHIEKHNDQSNDDKIFKKGVSPVFLLSSIFDKKN